MVLLCFLRYWHINFYAVYIVNISRLCYFHVLLFEYKNVEINLNRIIDCMVIICLLNCALLCSLLCLFCQQQAVKDIMFAGCPSVHPLSVHLSAHPVTAILCDAISLYLVDGFHCNLALIFAVLKRFSRAAVKGQGDSKIKCTSLAEAYILTVLFCQFT